MKLLASRGASSPQPWTTASTSTSRSAARKAQGSRRGRSERGGLSRSPARLVISRRAAPKAAGLRIGEVARQRVVERAQGLVPGAAVLLQSSKAGVAADDRERGAGESAPQYWRCNCSTRDLANRRKEAKPADGALILGLVPEIRLHRAVELDRQRIAVRSLRLARGHADPALADAILFDIGLLDALEADADAPFQQLGVV